MFRSLWLTIALTAVLLLSPSALCQQSSRPYDGIQAGYDAYQLGEEKRQRNAGQQIYLNDRMRAQAIPLATYGYGYGPYASTYGMMPASRDYAYAFGNSPDRYYPGFGSRDAGRPLTVFEPWPYLPGDIWGDVYTPLLRQPVAQAQSQTGRNRWESHPVYTPPLYTYSALPPVNSPTLHKTPYATEPPTPDNSADDAPIRPRRRVF